MTAADRSDALRDAANDLERSVAKLVMDARDLADAMTLGSSWQRHAYLAAMVRHHAARVSGATAVLESLVTRRQTDASASGKEGGA